MPKTPTRQGNSIKPAGEIGLDGGLLPGTNRILGDDCADAHYLNISHSEQQIHRMCLVVLKRLFTQFLRDAPSCSAATFSEPSCNSLYPVGSGGGFRPQSVVW